jgi:hypothetical protein
MSGQRETLDDGSIYAPEFTLGYFRNTFLMFLQMTFGSEFAPKEYKYLESDEDTLIKIEAASADNLKTVDHRPRIIVARGPFKWHNKSGIGHLQQTKNLNSGPMDKFVVDIVSGSIRISTISREDLESEVLANHVLFLIRRFKQQIARSGLLSIQDFSVSATSMIRGQDGGILGYATAVDISVMAQDRWLIENNAKNLLKKIETVITTTP